MFFILIHLKSLIQLFRIMVDNNNFQEPTTNFQRLLSLSSLRVICYAPKVVHTGFLASGRGQHQMDIFFVVGFCHEMCNNKVSHNFLVGKVRLLVSRRRAWWLHVPVSGSRGRKGGLHSRAPLLYPNLPWPAKQCLSLFLFPHKVQKDDHHHIHIHKHNKSWFFFLAYLLLELTFTFGCDKL